MTNQVMLLLIAVLPALGLTAYVDMEIINGSRAKPDSRPYMVSVQRGGSHCCGGFLISEYFVMTAAHCLERREDLEVVLGIHNMPKKGKGGSNRRAVRYYHIHPGFNRTTLENDIMLLQLSEKVKKNKSVQWVPLPKKNEDVKANSPCSVAGWGVTSTEGRASEQLMETNVIVMDQKYCKQSWSKGFSPSRMLCATGTGGFCLGDSGGPLMCKKKAVGVVSFFEDRNCDKPHVPNVYTKISKFIPWINALTEGTK